MPRTGTAVQVAVLALLERTPLHGYELRKRLTGVLGWGRALSYGSLYPALRSLQRAGLITEQPPAAAAAAAAAAPADAAGATGASRRGAERGGAASTDRARRRSRVVYQVSPAGRARLAELLADAGPAAYDDDGFGVRLALFARTDAAVRLRILQGRRRRLEERLEQVQAALSRTRERLDGYELELRRHAVESAEREVRWVGELLAREAAAGPAPDGAPDRPTTHPSSPSAEPTTDPVAATTATEGIP